MITLIVIIVIHESFLSVVSSMWILKQQDFISLVFYCIVVMSEIHSLNWTIGIEDGCQYALTNSRGNFDHVKSLCENQGSYLAMIKTNENWNSLIKVLEDEGNDHLSMWVGITNAVKKCKKYSTCEFTWIDGSQYVPSSENNQIQYFFGSHTEKCGFYGK